MTSPRTAAAPAASNPKPLVLPADAPAPARRFSGLAGFLGSFALLAAVAALAYYQLTRFRSDIQWDEHTHEVAETIERCRGGLLAADAMRRSYRLSLEPGDRILMETRISETLKCMDSLAALTADNPNQQKRIETLRPMVSQRIDIMRTGIDLPRMETLAPEVRDQQRAIQSRGTALAKQVRVVFDAMGDEERRLLSERQARSLASARATQLAIVLGGALGLAFVAAFYFSLLRENRQRQLVQDQLTRTNSIVSAVVEGTPDIVSVRDRDGRYLLANQALATYARRDVGDILGKPVAEVMSPEAARVLQENDQAILRSGEAHVVEQQLSNHGAVRTFLTTKAAYRDETGQIVGVISVARDITERKQLDSRLADQNIERGRIIERLERQTADLAVLSEMGGLLQSAADGAEAFRVVGHFAPRLFNRPGGLSVIAASRNTVDLVTTWGGATLGQRYPPIDCWALRTGRVHRSDGGSSVSCPHLDTLAGQCIPLVAQGETRGVIHLLGEPLDEPARVVLANFTEQISLALANLQLRETLRSQAIRDPLTGLFNRRYMDETLSRELNRAQRQQAPLSVVMIDLDHFKRLNDTFGHAAGDAVLKRFGEVLQRSTRREDVACRYGGEELAVILPDAPLERAQERAEQWRQELEKIRLEMDGRVVGPLSASFGVACSPQHGSTTMDLLAAADGALYEAKHQGRNRVLTAATVVSHAA